MTLPQYRNAKIIWDNLIDCEINHPKFGWIPFTADPTDTGAEFDVASLHAQMIADPNTLPWDGKYPKFVPASITRRQCAMQLFSLQMITGEEAIAMTQTGAPPASVMAYINTLTEPQQTMAVMDFAATNYFRDNALLLALMEANNMSSDDVDNFFIAAAVL